MDQRPRVLANKVASDFGPLVRFIKKNEPVSATGLVFDLPVCPGQGSVVGWDQRAFAASEATLEVAFVARRMAPPFSAASAAAAARSCSSAHSTRLRDRPILRSSVSTRRNFDLDLVADLDDVLGVFDLVVGQLGDVQQAFQAVFQPDEDAEVGDLGDRAVDQLAGLVLVGNVAVPRVVVQLLEAQRDAATRSCRPTARGTSISWPFSSISLGWLIFRVQDMSETCSRPSMPSSSSMKAP